MKQESESSILNQLSFSKLSLFNESLTLFDKRYISKTLPAKKTDAFDYGTLVERMLFFPNEVVHEYDTDKPPKVTGKMGAFIESMAKLQKENDSFGDLPFRVGKDEMYLTSWQAAEFKVDIESIIKDFKLPENQRYYEYLLKDKQKKQVTLEDWNKAKKQAEAIYTNKFTKDCFSSNGQAQLEIVWNHPILPEAKFVSILDYLEVNRMTKTIYIRDLKTTSKPYEYFPDSIRLYKYDWQGALYVQAVKHLIKLGGLPNFDISYEIVVSENFNPFRTVVFKLSDQTLYNATIECSNVVEKIKWHIENNQWDYPKELIDNNGVIVY